MTKEFPRCEKYTPIGRRLLRNIDFSDRSNQAVSIAGNLSIEVLSRAFSTIERHNMRVDKIVMHPVRFADLRLLDKGPVEFFSDSRNVFEMVKNWLLNFRGYYGEIWGAKICVSNRVPEGNIYMLPKKNKNSNWGAEKCCSTIF